MWRIKTARSVANIAHITNAQFKDLTENLDKGVPGQDKCLASHNKTIYLLGSALLRTNI